ncbi:LuxR family transcriptional regulator [Mycobacterium sp. 1274756.6]|uniref:helix-turn-helix transcriptional regulator n=1 Tax=Mycobacterium sp. 1274756.6 TaxID=1834076 RepID=UPI0007FC2A3C|nr:LuxR family transcriptional regulator [Mycobacterium sp. 1274756.6]OBJ73606.1 hypothetical protein A5643_03440 [Mycobacterium sp. 1274756.6]
MSDDFSRLVSEIYATILTPALWETVVTDIGHTIGDSETALLAPLNGFGRQITHANLPAAISDTYNRYYARRDPLMAAVEAGPVGVVRTRAELVERPGRTEIDADWCLPNGFREVYFALLTTTPGPTSIAVKVPKSIGVSAAGSGAPLLRQLVPHLRQALRTREQLDELDCHNRDLALAGEFLQHGVVILAAGGRILHANSAAEGLLRLDDGLRRQLARVEAEYLRADPAKLAGSFLCPRPSGKRSYIIHVVPTTQPVPDFTRSPRRMVIIVDPELQQLPPAGLLRRLYGLTRSEAEVAVMVLRGHGLKTIAETLSVSLATVKTHLQHVFDKTDTHRQAELVRLLLNHGPCLHPAQNDDGADDGDDEVRGDVARESFSRPG